MFEIEPIANLIAAGTALQAFPETKKAIDKGLSQSVQLVFDAPKYFNEHSKDMLLKIKNKVYTRLERTPLEKIVQPPAYITVPALQAITYSIDSDELHNLFANLLASSMDSRKQSNAHPAFVEIIKNMSPKDATILSAPELSIEKTFAICDAFLNKGESKHTLGFPFASANTGAYLLKNIVLLNDNDISLDDISFSIVNFVRLGLLDVSSEHFVNVSLYQHFKDNFEKIKVYTSIEENLKNLEATEVADLFFSLIPKTAAWTPLGLKFINTCVK